MVAIRAPAFERRGLGLIVDRCESGAPEIPVPATIARWSPARFRSSPRWPAECDLDGTVRRPPGIARIALAGCRAVLKSENCETGVGLLHLNRTSALSVQIKAEVCCFQESARF